MGVPVHFESLKSLKLDVMIFIPYCDDDGSCSWRGIRLKKKEMEKSSLWNVNEDPRGGRQVQVEYFRGTDFRDYRPRT